ncbi:similar to stage IV sporulation protein [Paenibacillus algorifonticola]|uniref:Similar to stage IV sporulation protein n=1 Tax=Paenibacillus algorifonticola TaxID=684063 RepID=A0A1I1ZWB7_9BACL|nr:sporulation protein YqfD [Paenibacillus algorifonticola]SFE35926.1 similar to stage IV sporulation protein [Paenibacillus algorifonticola]
MKLKWSDWVLGVVTVNIRGGQPERLVNRALEGGLQLASIGWTGDGKLQFDVSVSDYFRLKPFLKETGCRAHVVRRQGMPFWLVKLEKRKFFIAGLALFFIGIYVLSSLIWSVEVKGNVKLTEEEIVEAARQEGIFPLQWSFRLADTDIISKRLVNKLPKATWIGVEKKGTRIIIQVAETTEPDHRELENPRHLIASADAVVTEIYTERGRAVVKKNAKVKKGQTLISGTLGGGAYTQTVVAKGSVRGIVWYEFNIASPMSQQVKVYTGEKKQKWYVVIGGRALQVSGYGKNPYEQSETIVEEDKANWKSISLPFGRMKQTVMEVHTEERKLSADEARAGGILQAKANVMSKAGSDAVIRDEIVLHEKTENGKVYMKVLFEVEQSIVKEMPLVQMQGD